MARRERTQFEVLAEDGLRLLLAAPVLLLALLPLLAGVPSTESAGPAWAALFLAPLAGILWLSPATRRLGLPHLVLLALAVFAAVRGLEVADSFGARRATLVWSTSLLAFLAGSLLDRKARLWSVTWIAALPLILLAWILYHLSQGHDGRSALAQSLGNRSDLAEFAWPGIVAACCVFLTTKRRGPAIALGLGAAGLVFLLGWSPVWTAIVVLGGSAVAAFLFGYGRAWSARLARLLLVLTAVAVAGMGLRLAGGGSAPANPEADTPPSAAVGAAADGVHGVRVRQEIWSASADLIAARPWLGGGTGQFEAAFPPYRTAAEIAASSHDGAAPSPVEVEHPHNDFVLITAELGLPAGVLFAGLCLYLCGCAIWALRRGDRSRTPAAVVWLGTMAFACANGPLLAPVWSHVLPWWMAGMLVTPRGFGRRPGRALAVVGCLGALAVLPWALAMVEHGRALAQAHAGETLDPAAFAEALRHAPDSPEALDLYVHSASTATDADWQRLAAVRPNHKAVFNDLAIRQARAGQWAEAEKNLAHALELDARFAPAWRNRVHLLEDSHALVELAAVLPQADQAGAVPRAQWRPRALYWLGQGRPSSPRSTRAATTPNSIGRVAIGSTRKPRWPGPSTSPTPNAPSASGSSSSTAVSTPSPPSSPWPCATCA
ncbi:MAG: O-antigen ligase family protein [Planctomycetota bacterium]